MIKTLYVGNLPWTTTPEDLTELLSAYGEVISARIATDRETGRSRGFGFVEIFVPWLRGCCPAPATAAAGRGRRRGARRARGCPG